MAAFVYCPSARGHARELTTRLFALAGVDCEWLKHPHQLTGIRAGLVYLAELKHSEALADALSGFSGPVAAQLMHALPHHLPYGRRQALMRLYHRADALLTPHAAVAEALQAMGVAGSKIVVLQGYPYRRMRRPLPGKRSRKLLLALGFQNRASGVDRLGVLCERFRREADVSMVVAGEMDLSDELRLRRRGCLVINRFLDERRMRHWLLRADALLMPYRKRVESPLVNRAIEAGIPVIRTPGVLDWNGRSDFDGVALAWDVAAWPAAIRWLLQDRTRAAAHRNLWAGNELLRVQMQSFLAGNQRSH